MPLVAIIDGERLFCPDLSATELSALRRRYRNDDSVVRMTCCDAPGFLRMSTHGILHAVHRERAGCASRESWQHQRMKLDFVLGARRAGWNADAEVDGDGWRADVLCTRGRRRVALEAQWSRQTAEVTRERTRVMLGAGIDRVAWFFQSTPRGLERGPDLPFWPVREGNGAFATSVGHDIDLPLADAVERLMSGRLCFRAQCWHPVDGFTIGVILRDDHECGHCGASMRPYRLSVWSEGMPHFMGDTATDWGSGPRDPNPWIRDTIEELRRKGHPLPLWRKVQNRRFRNLMEWRQVCPECVRALTVPSMVGAAASEPDFFYVVDVDGFELEDEPHWCDGRCDRPHNPPNWRSARLRAARSGDWLDW